ncbi:MAG: redox-sensitive transcriptional activator SoxR [Acidimicrobiales bacterium]|nr:redox-sensitive transcriptional activator SoxR [Acidimicrobiales bacterium]
MPRTDNAEELTIGAVARRTGLAVSAVRYYESEGLIQAERAPSGHRRFHRSVLRRLSFIRICQSLGYSLEEIAGQLERLPQGRTPTEADWTRLATRFAGDIDRRIADLQQLRDKLAGCIGCGCLSLQRCAIYNPNDVARGLGAGPRYLLGDVATDVVDLD